MGVKQVQVLCYFSSCLGALTRAVYKGHQVHRGYTGNAGQCRRMRKLLSTGGRTTVQQILSRCACSLRDTLLGPRNGLQDQPLFQLHRPALVLSSGRPNVPRHHVCVYLVTFCPDMSQIRGGRNASPGVHHPSAFSQLSHVPTPRVETLDFKLNVPARACFPAFA